ncbi:hypothetical protein D3OALGA1CA_3529 [Olavius algarvensis associated proteobacterium Delta 3]|nr:hypothetical protein D3OALGB2SA_3774 [Olavius algarvensis associated proteobacterium Delta 3]CAB5135822.1 hypothetical protein D3OALGA1CA_3529 [Olavius algarvensis associated proteobacterium Delta 3]
MTIRPRWLKLAVCLFESYIKKLRLQSEIVSNRLMSHSISRFHRD